MAELPLSVSLTGVTRIPVNRTQSFKLKVYNQTDTIAYNVNVTIVVSNGFKIVVDGYEYQSYQLIIDYLYPGEVTEFPFEIKAEAYTTGYVNASAYAKTDDTVTHRGEATVYITGAVSVETDWKVYTPDTGVSVLKWLQLTPTHIEQILERARTHYYAKLSSFIAHINIEGEDYTIVLARRSIRIIGRAGLDPEKLGKVLEFLNLPQPLGEPEVVGSLLEWATLTEDWTFRQPWTGISMVVTGYFPLSVIEEKWNYIKENGGELIGFNAYCWTSPPGSEQKPEFILGVYPRMIRVTGRRAKDTDLLKDIQEKLLEM